MMGVSPRTLSLAVLAALGVVGMSFASPLGPTAGASPTAKTEQIDGVPLVPAPRSQRAECRDLARHLDRAVPCPGLVPDPIPTSPTSASGYCVDTPGACGPAQVWVYRTSLLMTQMNFQVPDGYVGGESPWTRIADGCQRPPRTVDHWVTLCSRQGRVSWASTSHTQSVSRPRSLRTVCRFKGNVRFESMGHPPSSSSVPTLPPTQTP